MRKEKGEKEERKGWGICREVSEAENGASKPKSDHLQLLQGRTTESGEGGLKEAVMDNSGRSQKIS